MISDPRSNTVEAELLSLSSSCSSFHPPVVSLDCSKLRSMEERRKREGGRILMALIILVEEGGRGREASDIFPLFFARGEIRRVIVYN